MVVFGINIAVIGAIGFLLLIKITGSESYMEM
jgi:hypothetical protein